MTKRPSYISRPSFADFKEGIIKEWKMMGVKHYYADVATIDLSKDLYAGYDKKRSVRMQALLTLPTLREKYGKYGCMVNDDGPCLYYRPVDLEAMMEELKC